MTNGDHDDDQEGQPDTRGLSSYRIDENTVRVNNPDRNEPDKIIRKLATGKIKTYDAKKRK